MPDEPNVLPAIPERDQRFASSQEYLDGVRADIQAHADDLIAHRDQVQAEYDRIMARVESELAPLQVALDRLDGKHVKRVSAKRTAPRRVMRRQASGTATGFGVSLEVAVAGAEAIKKLVAEREAAGQDQRFTQREFYRLLDWDQSKGSQCIRFLRSAGFLRAAGKGGGGKGTAGLWAIMDAEVVDRLVREAEAQGYEPIPEVQEREERVIAALREHGPVRGYTALGDLTQMQPSMVNHLCRDMAERGAIALDGARGRSTIISLNEEAQAA